MKIVISPRAEDDLEGHFLTIAEDRPMVAENFLSAVEETFERLSFSPKMGSPKAFENARLAAIRMLPVSGFRPYLVFYLIRNEHIHIVRILHAARDIKSILEKD